MNAMNKFLFFSFLLCCYTPVLAQKFISARSTGSNMTTSAAATLVNPKVSGTFIVGQEKSSFASASANVAMIRTYDRTIRVSYQIPAHMALEWNTIRYRASDVLNRDYGYLVDNPTLYEAIYNLAVYDFVPLSSFGTVTVKLNFRYNRTSPYRTDRFAPKYDAPPISTKNMVIRK
jgi:hypothetical protein